jgi:hypothetical protein
LARLDHRRRRRLSGLRGLSGRLAWLHCSALRPSGLRGLALRCGRLRGLSGRLAWLDHRRRRRLSGLRGLALRCGRLRGLSGRLAWLHCPALLLTGTLALVLLARLLLRHNDRPVGSLGNHGFRMPEEY